MIPFLAAIGAAVDFSRIAACRAVLQRAADSAALSGAAAYSLDSAKFNALAIQTATSAFCSATTAFPDGASLVVQSGAQACGAAPGPVVTAVTDSFVPGTPGLSHAGGVSCTGTYLPAAPYRCGFIVTVSAAATFTPMFSLLGWSVTLTVQGMAANPFLDFGTIFSLPNGILTGAKYANSVWAYPLALNSTGGVDYSANAGALPDASTCTGGPDQVACGNYVMLASTMYAGKGTGYTPPGQSVIYDNGRVRNPVTPTHVTATTPLGIAFRSIAGGNYVQFSPPGVYGYQVVNPGALPIYIYANNLCIYPYYKLAYGTVGQVWSTVTSYASGVPVTTYVPVLPWTLVTHWFYSSYLTQNEPPSQSEINAQNAGMQDIPSVPADPAQAGGNIAGKSTYNAIPIPAVATTCPSTSVIGGVTLHNDTFVKTSYKTSGLSNCSLYIGTSSSSGYTPPNGSYTGSCFDPTATPGQQYAAMNCQQFGNQYYNFYWNDMGGAATDDENYADGIVQIGCQTQSHVILID